LNIIHPVFFHQFGGLIFRVKRKKELYDDFRLREEKADKFLPTIVLLGYKKKIVDRRGAFQSDLNAFEVT